MLYGLLLPSGADAALALSNHLFGSEESLVKEMNRKVVDWKLKHTHFVNTTGLDIENHYSSVEDVALILKAKKPYHILDANTIYFYFFNQYEYKTLLTNRQLLITIPDENAENHSFYSDKEIIKYLSKNSKIDYRYEGVDMLSYNMKKGDKIGEYQTLVDGEVVDRQEFYLEEEIVKPFQFPWNLFLLGIGIVKKK